jgi:hypothetical protein
VKRYQGLSLQPTPHVETNPTVVSREQTIE